MVPDEYWVSNNLIKVYKLDFYLSFVKLILWLNCGAFQKGLSFFGKQEASGLIILARFYIPNNNTKLITKPIRPEASTKEKPINEKRNNYNCWS